MSCKTEEGGNIRAPTCVLQVWWISHKQHVCVGRVCDTNEASLVLQRGRDANAGSVGMRSAVVVAVTHWRSRHHLTHRHTGVLQPQDYTETQEVKAGV